MMRALLKFSDQTTSTAPIAASDALFGNALFEAVVCEFHWTALQIGAIACCMNASLATRRSWMLRACSNLVPIESPVVRIGLRSWQDIGLSRDLAADVRRIYFDLADAKTLALPLINSAGSFVAPTIPLAKLEQITAVWGKLAEDCRDAVLELEPETRWRLSGGYTANALVLSKFLKDAMNGSRACVNHHGEVALPILPQRRRTPRYRLDQPCKISWQSGSMIAFARNISKDGLNLDCDRELPPREAVSIGLRNGRKMQGLIVRSKDRQADIRFDNPLADDDKLLAG